MYREHRHDEYFPSSCWTLLSESQPLGALLRTLVAQACQIHETHGSSSNDLENDQSFRTGSVPPRSKEIAVTENTPTPAPDPGLHVVLGAGQIGNAVIGRASDTMAGAELRSDSSSRSNIS